MSRTRCEYCGGDVESAGIGGTICNADRGPNDEGPARLVVPAFNRVPCNVCGDVMTLDTERREMLEADGLTDAVCADCAGYYVDGPSGPMFCRGPRS